MKLNRALTFLASISLVVCLIFIGVAHDEERARLVTQVQIEKDNLDAAEGELEDLEEEGYLGAAESGAHEGAVLGAVGGATAIGLAGGLTGSAAAGVPGAVVGGSAGVAFGALAGGIGGGIVGSIGGMIGHYNNLQDAQEEVEEQRREVAAAQQALEIYDYENSDYRKSCSKCGSMWTFSTYDEYMNFSHYCYPLR